jgi:hypothetical protein
MCEKSCERSGEILPEKITTVRKGRAAAAYGSSLKSQQ